MPSPKPGSPADRGNDPCNTCNGLKYITRVKEGWPRTVTPPSPDRPQTTHQTEKVPCPDCNGTGQGGRNWI